MTVDRRSFVQSVLGGALLSAVPRPLPARSQTKFRIGVTDWNLKQSSKLAAVSVAKECGFAGVQIALGRELVDGRLALDDPELQKRYLAEAKDHGIALTSTCIDRLHRNYLKNDKLGQRWVLDSIPITRALGLKVILLPFFGKGAIEQRPEMDYVGDVIREIAPEAEKAGVILGLEDTISAEDNVRIMERSRSPAVLTYYDIGNSTRRGFDAVKEIRWLGKDRICEIHIKDNPHYLGEGSIDIQAVVGALNEIGFDQWAVLETTARPEHVVADMKKNLTYFSGVIDSSNT